MSRHGGNVPGTVYMPPFDRIVSDGLRDGARILDRHRRRRIAALAACAVLATSCAGGAYVWWDTHGRARQTRMQTESECSSRVEEMTAAYRRASELYDRVTERFDSLDESYDLDALAALRDESPGKYRVLRCSADAGKDAETAVSLERSYEGLSARYEKALKPVAKQ